MSEIDRLREQLDDERRAHQATRAELDNLTRYHDAVVDGRDDLYCALNKLVTTVGDLIAARNEAATEIARFNSVLPVGMREVERQRNALKHRKAQIQAEALREAARDLSDGVVIPDWRAWLRQRADQIERGEVKPADSELPGMWESADFTGGIDEVRGPGS